MQGVVSVFLITKEEVEKKNAICNGFNGIYL